jgi:hypothetical protein
MKTVVSSTYLDETIQLQLPNDAAGLTWNGTTFPGTPATLAEAVASTFGAGAFTTTGEALTLPSTAPLTFDANFDYIAAFNNFPNGFPHDFPFDAQQFMAMQSVAAFTELNKGKLEFTPGTPV